MADRWQSFKDTYQRSYDSVTEEQRYDAFLLNLKVRGTDQGSIRGGAQCETKVGIPHMSISPPT